MAKTERDEWENCFICNEFMGTFKNNLTVTSSFSDKPIYQIFGKIFAGFLRTNFEGKLFGNKILESFTSQIMSNEMIKNAAVCQNCFIKFNEFDEHQSIAFKIQQELMLLYESSLATDMKLEIKREPETAVDYGIVEVMLENLDDLSDNSENFKKFTSSTSPKERNLLKLSSRSFERSEKRPYKRKKNLDEGLTVVEVDGRKIYQCEICKKLCKDRYKLKTHREIHTTERTVCCNECGAMFKTLTCLYSHKKIHRERIYHQW